MSFTQTDGTFFISKCASAFADDTLMISKWVFTRASRGQLGGNHLVIFLGYAYGSVNIGYKSFV